MVYRMELCRAVLSQGELKLYKENTVAFVYLLVTWYNLSESLVCSLASVFSWKRGFSETYLKTLYLAEEAILMKKCII